MTSKKKVSYIIGLVSAAVIVLLLLMKQCEGNKTASVHQSAPSPYLRPIFDTGDYTRFTLTAGRDTVFVHQASGTKISVPGCTQFYNQESEAQASVQLHYRYFGTPADIIQAGIPMEIGEKAGTYFASDGMMELLAYNPAGNPVQPAGKCEITIEWPAADTANEYNLYKLDTNARKWNEVMSNVKHRIKKTISGITPSTTPNVEKLAKAAGLELPVKPMKKDKSRFSFNFKTDLSALPELNVYDGVYWEYAGNKASENPDNNPWVKNMIWDEMNISATGKKGTYTLTLIKGSQKFVTTVRPVFDAADMEYAMEIYEAKYKKYSAFVEKKKEEQRQKMEAIQRQIKVRAANEEVNRSFAINEMGFWNIDRVLKEETNLLSNVQFESEGNILQPQYVYLIPGGVRSAVYFSIQNNRVDELRWFKEQNNLVLIVDNEGNLHKTDHRALNKALSKGTSTVQTQHMGKADAEKIASLTSGV